MVEASTTILILIAFSAITGLMLHVLPEHWKEWVWVKLHLDNYEPYDDIDED